MDQPAFPSKPTSHRESRLAAPAWGCFHGPFTDTADTCPSAEACAYLECTRRKSPHRLFRSLLLRLWLHVSPHLLFYTLLICGPTKPQDPLVNLLLAVGKLTISQTRKEAPVRGNPSNCRAVFPSLLCSCLQTGFQWVVSTDSLDIFESQRALAGVLCSVPPLHCSQPAHPGPSLPQQLLLPSTPRDLSCPSLREPVPCISADLQGLP